MTDTRTRTLAHSVADGEWVTGYWSTFTDPATVELVAGHDVDFVVVDAEHTPSTYETVAALVRAVDAAPGGAEPVVRVDGNDPVTIKRVLDLDPAGLVVPMVSTGEEARELVEATRYAPDGVRGVGPGRASGYGRETAAMVERDADDLWTVAQIETTAGVDNARDIAAVDGLDSVFVGPADLSTALGSFGAYDDAFRDAVDHVLEAGADHDTPVGTLATSPEDAERWVDWGFDWMVAGLDVVDLSASVERSLGRCREARGTDE